MKKTVRATLRLMGLRRDEIRSLIAKGLRTVQITERLTAEWGLSKRQVLEYIAKVRHEKKEKPCAAQCSGEKTAWQPEPEPSLERPEVQQPEPEQAVGPECWVTQAVHAMAAGSKLGREVVEPVPEAPRRLFRLEGLCAVLEASRQAEADGIW